MRNAHPTTGGKLQITGDFLKSRHGVEGNDELMKRLNGVTDAITGKALE